MKYKSTRNSDIRLEASEVIVKGISDEGGLFVPESLPNISALLPQFAKLNYSSLAAEIFRLYLSDFSFSEIENCVRSAYSEAKFGVEPVKLVSLPGRENKHVLELWHGPTCAFKDMALQILPHFLTAALNKSAPNSEAVILVATSGDTGKAALEGFRDVKRTKVLVFYPQDGVSSMQKRQMATQEGENLAVCAINGNFDDAQAVVKQIFTDENMQVELENHKMIFSSANSINWGRLLPQIVYYFYAYFQLYNSGRIAMGDPINVVVPTGNFGNILAAYYAREMGLPVKRFICASNANRVLTDFIRSGVYDRRREFYATTSPSMDILVSSNLERLLYALSDEDSACLSGWMKQLASCGHYDVGAQIHKKISDLFYGGFCEDSSTAAMIHDTWKNEGYLPDTHTAVGLEVYRQYVEDTNDSDTAAVIASTASPYKFVKDVLGALEPVKTDDEFDNIFRLEQLTKIPVPKPLLQLRNKPVRFTNTIETDQAAKYILSVLNIGADK